MPEVQIKGEEIRKVFRVGTQEIEVLKGITFEIDKGDFVIVSGPSGCGKSTLLHTILGLEPPTSGKILFFDQDLYFNTNEDARSIFRKRHIGMVYQQANWIKALNVRENVSFPLTLLGVSKHEAFTKSLKVIGDLGMASWAEYMPLELSSGQQQRVALARSLINDPKVIVADEPTGNLDFKSGVEIMELLSKLNREMQKTVIMVTHDLEYLKYSNKVIRIFDGNLEGIYTGESLQKLIGSVSLKRGSVQTDEDRNAAQADAEKTATSESTGSTGSTEPTQPQAGNSVSGSADLLSKNATTITASSGVVAPPGETQAAAPIKVSDQQEPEIIEQAAVIEDEPALVGGPVQVIKRAKPRKFKRS